MTEHHVPSTRPHPTLTDDRHLPASWVTAYAEGGLDPVLLGHAEPHLRHCHRCSGAVNEAVRLGPYGARLDGLHTALLDGIGGGPPASPAPPPSRRTARRTGPPPWLAVTQGLRLSWLVAIVCVCGLGVGLSQLSGSDKPRVLLLLLAPVLPVLCVAGSYGGRADPFAEVTRTTPAGGLRVLLLRTAQTLVVCVPLLTGAATLMPRSPDQPPYTSAGWLLPCLAVTLATLLLSSYWGSWVASLTTGCGWLLLVYVLAKAHEKAHKGPLPDRMFLALSGLQHEFVEALGMITFAAVSAVLAELLVLRRHAFTRLGAQ